MKRWMSLVLVMAMALSMMPAGLAEEFFAEEEFAAEESFESEGFFEEEFFAEESAETEEVEEIDMEEEAAELEDRSIVSLVTDQVDPETSVTTDNYWMAKPILTGGPTTNKKGDVANSVTLTWTWPASLMMPSKKGPVTASKLPKDVKWYVYEVEESTGVAKQVGKPLGMKGFKQADKTSLYGGTVTIKNVAAGVHKYFVRAEQLTKQKDKSFHEEYGLSSEIKPVTVSDAVSTLWKKLTGIEALQVEKDHITIQVTAEEMLAADQYDVAVKASKPKGFTADSAKIEKKISGDTMLINDTNGYEDGAKVTYTVTPVKNSVNGTKKSISVTVQEALWKCAPDIIDAMVVDPKGNGQPTLRMSFLPMDLEANNLAFNVKGFAKAMFVKKEENGEWAAYDKYDEIGKPAKAQKVPLTKVTEDDGVITVVSVIKKAGGKVTFTVQPQASEEVLKKEVPTGKYKVVKGTASAKYVLATQKDELSGATDIQTESTKAGLGISWYCANPNADYFNVSLVEQGKDFITDSKVAYEPNVKDQTVTFPGIDVGAYTVFVETILKNGGGRIVTEFSFSYNAEMTSEKLFKPEISEANLKSITDNSPYYNKSVVVVIDGAQPGDKYKVKIDGKEYETELEYTADGLSIDLVEMAGPGEHTIKIAGYENENIGTWSDPITVAAYAVMEAEVEADAEKIIKGENATLTATATGGAGEYTYTFYQNGTEVQSGEKSEYVFTGTAPGEYKFTVEVKDSVVNESTTSNKVTVKVVDEVDDENGNYTFKLVEDEKGREVAYLVATSYDKSVTAVEKVPSTIRGRTVVRICAADATEGVFQNFTALKSIELPNTIEEIGANAFNGCTSLATMTCY